MLNGQRNSRSIIGGVAQLGERLNGIQEASSSILLISTRKIKREEHDNGVLPFLYDFHLTLNVCDAPEKQMLQILSLFVDFQPLCFNHRRFVSFQP